MGYDDDQGPLLARIYFPQTGIFELHDNSYICYQTLNDEVERKTGALPASTIVRDLEEYKYLIGTRHVDPDSGCTYETTEIKVTPNQDIVAWQKRFYNGKLDKNHQGPFFAEDIREYTQQTLRTGISKRGNHNKNKANAISIDNPFVMLALEQIQAAIVDDKSPTKQGLDREDYEPPTRRLMLQCKQQVKWEEAE